MVINTGRYNKKSLQANCLGIRNILPPINKNVEQIYMRYIARI